MIQLNLDKSKINDSDYMLNAINTLFMQKVIEGQTLKYKTCFDFYMGLEPKVTFKDAGDYECRVINLTKPIVDIATETFIGDLPDIVTSGKKPEKDKISVLNQKLYNRQFGNHIYEALHYSSKCGSGLLALYNLIGDTFPRFREINPKFGDVVYDCSLEQQPLFAFYIIESNNAIGGQPSQTKYIIYAYTNKKIFSFESPMTYLPQTTVPNADKQMFITPYFAWKTVKDGKEVGINEVEHGFGDIPIVEFPNNADYKGDAECVFDLIRLYNEVTNNRCKNLHDVVNYILFIKNVQLGNEEETQKVVDLLKQHHILPAEGDNVDAKFLTNPLNQEQMETLANNILDSIRLISRVPDLSSVDFSQNASDPIIKIKTKPLLDLCKEKEKKCTEPYMRVLRMVLNWCKKYSKDFSEFDVDLDNVSLEYTHALPSNDGDMANMIAVLSNAGMANPENNLQQLSFIKNVHNYMKGMNKWNDTIDKRKATRNNNDSGINDTNLERQNATPQSRKQQDNMKNYVKGKSDDLSDNKVE